MGLCDHQLTTAGTEIGKPIDAKEFDLTWDLSNKKLTESLVAIDNKAPVKTK